MSYSKNAVTEALRDLIKTDAGFLFETTRADLLQMTLSFQSRVKAERHVWIDTQMGDDGNGFTIDLEDWAYQDNQGDNTVATADTPDAYVVRDVAQAWLRGDALDTCLSLCIGCKTVRKLT